MIYLIAIIIAISPGGLQDDCGNGLPCGPIPWPVPQLPVILSPTPAPTTLIQATATPSITPAPTETPQTTTTPEAEFEPDEIVDLVGDIEEVISQTPVPVDIGGQVFDLDSIDDLPDTSVFWSHLLGIFGVNLGSLQPIIVISILGFGIVLTVKVAGYLISVFGALLGAGRKVIEFALKLIPGFR